MLWMMRERGHGAANPSDRGERIRRSPNFRKGSFQNPGGTPVMLPGKAFAATREWLTSRKQARPSGPLPFVALTRESFADPPLDDLRFCWLGHSTVLLEMEGTRVLFDPVWAKRSSPVPLLGPARFQPVPLVVDELPELAAVVISHDHYDHLDKDLVQHLSRARPGLRFYVPLGVGDHLERWGVVRDRIHDLDWWDEATLGNGRVRLVGAPACHFSGRGILDRNRTLWASWVVMGGAHRAYFGGDGGYHAGFAEIGRRFGPFDLTMLEIGAYHPSWGGIHLGPENALLAHRDLRGRFLLPIHWAAFRLAMHAWDEPIATLMARAPALGVNVLVPKIGQIVRLAEVPRLAAWWRREPDSQRP